MLYGLNGDCTRLTLQKDLINKWKMERTITWGGVGFRARCGKAEVMFYMFLLG